MFYSKVEDTATGAIACQLLDIMHPGEVPMHKVNWGAKQNFEFVNNYKILQTCFTKLHIDKFIDVDRLITGKYMDNLEFMQWFKRFFELSVHDKGDYDCQTQRQKGKGNGYISYLLILITIYNLFVMLINKGWETIPVASKKPGSASRTASAVPVSKALKSASARVIGNTSGTANSGEPKTTKSSNNLPTKENQVPSKKDDNNTKSKSTSSSTSGGASTAIVQKYETEISSLKATVDSQSKQFSDLKSELEGTEKERDFYFEKLREIETMLQDVEDKGEGNDLTSAIFKVLYATADGFEAVQTDSIMSPSGGAAGAGVNNASFETDKTAPLVEETDTF